MKTKPRRLRPCPLHPDHPHSSLCASCLRDRLSLLNPTPTSSSSAAFPELRRSRTFSGNRCGTSDPARRSCEVRPRSTLENFFTVNEEAESDNLGFPAGTYPVPEVVEDESDCEIRVSDDLISPNHANAEAIHEIDQEEEAGDSKKMKEFIDLELKADTKPCRRDFKEIAGTFWVAASVFSRKLQKWKRKQNGAGGVLGGRRLRYTQSEVGEYGFGRRSWDSDPRVSIDLGRASIDGGGYPRRSLDLARSSVDCGRVFVDDEKHSSIDAPVVSVIENAMATVYGFNVNSMPPQTKLIITEKELMGSRKRFVKDELDSSDSNNLGTNSKDTTTTSSSSTSSSSCTNEIRDSRKWGKFSGIRSLFTRCKHPKKMEGEEVKSDPKWRLVRSSSVASSRFLVMA